MIMRTIAFGPVLYYCENNTNDNHTKRRVNKRKKTVIRIERMK